MQLHTVHLLVVSEFRFLQNSTSCLDIIVTFQPQNNVFGLPLAEILRYAKWETVKRCGARSSICYIPDTELSDEYLWPIEAKSNYPFSR
jgi:hypothetical protein